jgi:FixJ family two-component response regulator
MAFCALLAYLPPRRRIAQLAKVSLISIVDDDASVRESTKALVESLGYTVATFASAEEYLRSALVADTSCLLTDVKMPGMSGVELQERLISDDRCTPVIFMTAFPEERARVRARAVGASGFLSKPFTDESLIECLGRALKLGGTQPTEE